MESKATSCNSKISNLGIVEITNDENPRCLEKPPDYRERNKLLSIHRRFYAAMILKDLVDEVSIQDVADKYMGKALSFCSFTIRELNTIHFSSKRHDSKPAVCGIDICK